jgi:hypothetical protein
MIPVKTKARGSPNVYGLPKRRLTNRFVIDELAAFFEGFCFAALGLAGF